MSGISGPSPLRLQRSIKTKFHIRCGLQYVSIYHVCVLAVADDKEQLLSHAIYIIVLPRCLVWITVDLKDGFGTLLRL